MCIYSEFIANGVKESFFMLTSEPAEDFRAEASALLDRYYIEMADRGTSPANEFMIRFHLSDIYVQQPVLEEMLGPRDSFVSCVGQAPAHGGRLAMEAWHISGAKKKLVRSAETQSLTMELQNYWLLMFRKMSLNSVGSHDQMTEEFSSLGKELRSKRGKLSENTVRTWIYCRDVDNNYSGLVKARRKAFADEGMTADTHYIASTGIEGQNFPSSRLVSMDSLSVFGVKPSQFEYMSALDCMPPTHVYGVTFERGCRMIYGDRSHFFISGTASIDSKGEIVHPGDVRLQAGRMVRNVSALLENHDARLEDLKMATVYLRDRTDAPQVADELARLLPENLPVIMVQAPVCRPGWLVEMEAFGVNASGNPEYPVFA